MECVASCILHEICLLIELVIEASLCITLFIHGIFFDFIEIPNI